MLLESLTKAVKDARARIKAERPSWGYYTVVDELLQSPLPEEEKRDERLFLEAAVLVNAATEPHLGVSH
jgi:hypothetical protein